MHVIKIILIWLQKLILWLHTYLGTGVLAAQK